MVFILHCCSEVCRAYLSPSIAFFVKKGVSIQLHTMALGWPPDKLVVSNEISMCQTLRPSPSFLDTETATLLIKLEFITGSAAKTQVSG